MNEREIAELKDVLDHLQMEHCQFMAPADYPHHCGESYSTRSDKFTKEVREQTRLWRQTWVEAPIRRIIDKYEKKGG